MDFNITIGQAGLFAGFCLLLVLAVYLILVLSRINAFMRKLNEITGINADSITATCTLLPLLAANANGAAVEIRDSFASVGTAVDALDGSRSETAAAVSAGAENILNLITVAGTLVGNVVHSFTRRKRR